MSLKFEHDEIKLRFNEFIKNFLSDEKEIEKIEVLPNYWVVSVPSKDFKVTISCSCVGHFHGIEEWCAVVEEKNGEKNNFLLFQDEIRQWALNQKAKGL